MKKKNFYAVIMAGGGGTRLWPLSTREHPKQMLRISGDRTMFQVTIDRLSGLIDPDHILVVSTAEQTAKLKLQAPEIPEANYLIESMPKGTASVIGLAAIHLLQRSADATMAVLTADHFIKNTDLFQRLLRNGYDAAQENHLVTMGTEPTFASTGMGYIEQGERIPADFDLFTVSRFREKPDQATAESYLASGKFWWNSGMFLWKASRILQEISEYLPDLSKKLDIINQSLATEDYDRTMAEHWQTIEPATIDYGILEKARDVVFLPAKGLGWNDIGSWDSIFDVLPADENGNILMNCRSCAIDSTGTLTCSANPEKLIVTIGLKDMIVVETEKAVLVCPKSDTQRVREIVEYLKKNNLTAYL